MKWLRRIGYLVLVLAVIGSGAYYWLIVESHLPSEGSYTIDMAEVRRLADTLPGDKPTEIRVETVAHFSFPKTAVVAGDGWDPADMPVSSYQLPRLLTMRPSALKFRRCTEVTSTGWPPRLRSSVT